MSTRPATTTTTPDAPTLSPFVLGLDPGLSTGLAGYDPEADALSFVASARPLAVLPQLARWAGAGLILGAYVEDSRSLPIYARNRDADRGTRDRIARSVGRVDALTDLYLATLDDLGVPTACVEPVRAAKWDSERLLRLTGYDRPTNEHGRDAARLVYGCSIPS